MHFTSSLFKFTHTHTHTYPPINAALYALYTKAVISAANDDYNDNTR